MSASRDAVSGDHSAGLSTTVFPAASAGATFQVASISGAFHGVISAQTPAGSQLTWLRWPRVSKSSWPSRSSQSAKKRKLCATRGMTPRLWDRMSAPLSAVSTCASSSRRFSTPSAIACRIRARSSRLVRDQAGNARAAAATAASASAAPPRATSATGRSSMGERSVKAAADPTRSPPIQWSVSTVTPATLAIAAPPVRLVPNKLGERSRGVNHVRGCLDSSFEPEHSGASGRRRPAGGGVRSPRFVLVLSENWTLTAGRDLPVLVRWAREAEDAGFDAVMVSEHIVLGPDAGARGVMGNPREYALPGSQDPFTPWRSPRMLLASSASVTSRIRLAAAAVLAPLRHPLALARGLGTLDLLSEGRLVVQPTVSWSR